MSTADLDEQIERLKKWTSETKWTVDEFCETPWPSIVVVKLCGSFFEMRKEDAKGAGALTLLAHCKKAASL